MDVLAVEERLTVQRKLLCGREEEIALLEDALKEPCQEEGTTYYLRAVMEPLICEWDRLSEPEIQACLTGYFVDDLNDSLSDIAASTEKEHHLIITLDALEKPPHGNDKDWFLEKLLPKLKKHCGLSLALTRNFPLSGDGRAAFSPMK